MRDEPGYGASVKRRPAKANCQRDDRAFAEFDAVLRKLEKAPKPPKPAVDVEAIEANYRKPIR